MIISLILKNIDSLISTSLSAPKSPLLKEGLSGCLKFNPSTPTMHKHFVQHFPSLLAYFFSLAHIICYTKPFSHLVILVSSSRMSAV